MKKLNSLLKDFILFIRISQIFQPIAKFFSFVYYLNLLIKYIYEVKGNVEFRDFYVPNRDYDKRNDLYDYVFKTYSLASSPILYMEFGVAGGDSFYKFMNLNDNKDSKFYGFDTFEGLPEDWGGFFKKGDMSYNVPVLDDERGMFVKGLFQDTLNDFINQNREKLESNSRKLIHMDADLYSATIFTLSQLYPYLKKGDIIFFDEFNVPMHEFKAFYEFTKNFYIKLEPIGSVNNFYQTAFVVE